MRTDRRRLNRSAAERLLRGGSASGSADPQADRDALAGLLAAAVAPAHGRELAGEAEAVTAFRDALLGPAPQPRRPLMSATKLFAAKAVLAAVGLSGGGVALAAATGHLPSDLGGAPAAAGPAAAATAMPSAPSASGKPADHPAASPSPSLRGLCQAYTARVGSSPGKALGNPAFSALIAAAGGKDKVAAFCASLPAARPGHGPASHPGGKPSSLPAPANTAHPAGRPAAVPAGHPAGRPAAAPAGHPTGAPTSHP